MFDDPQVRAQEMVIEVEHPGRGPVRTTGFPVRRSATPSEAHPPAPELGAHTDEVLRELGLEAEIPRLRAKGIV